MSWIVPTVLLLLAGFVVAFALCEWIVRRRATSSRNRRLPFEGKRRPHDEISWLQEHDEHQHGEF